MAKHVYPNKEDTKAPSSAYVRLIKAIRSSTAGGAFDRALSDLEKEVLHPTPNGSHRLLSELLDNFTHRDSFSRLEKLFASPLAPHPTPNSDFIELALKNNAWITLDFLLDKGFVFKHSDEKVSWVLNRYPTETWDNMGHMIPDFATRYQDILAEKCASALFMGNEVSCGRLNQLWGLVDPNQDLSAPPPVLVSQRLAQSHYFSMAQDKHIEKAVRYGFEFNWLDLPTLDEMHQNVIKKNESALQAGRKFNNHDNRLIAFLVKVQREIINQDTTLVKKPSSRPRL